VSANERSPIRVLVSDLGMVVLGFDFGRTLRYLKERKPDANVAEVLADINTIQYGMGADLGRCSGSEFLEAACAAHPWAGPSEDLARGWSDIFYEMPESLALVQAARVERRALLSNTNGPHWDWILRQYPQVIGSFDIHVPSHVTGLAKPAPAVYRNVERLTGLPPEAHLMIDDIGENVEGARRCGWDGVVFTSAAGLKRDLVERGLLEA